MHPSILAQRKAKAMDRIVKAARVLDPEHAEALQPQGVKDAPAAEMMRLEAIANLLERQVLTVTTVTAAEPPVIPDGLVQVTHHSLIAMDPGDGLPAPTLDEPPTEASKKSTGRKSKK